MPGVATSFPPSMSMETTSWMAERMDISYEQRPEHQGKERVEQRNQCVIVQNFSWLKDEMSFNSVSLIADELLGASDSTNVYLSQQLYEKIRESGRRQSVDLLLKHVLNGPPKIYVMFLKLLTKQEDVHIAKRLQDANPTDREIQEYEDLQNSSYGRCKRPHFADARFNIPAKRFEELCNLLNSEAVIDSLSDYFLTRHFFSTREHTNICNCIMGDEKRVKQLLHTMTLCSHQIDSAFTEVVSSLGMEHVISKQNVDKKGCYETNIVHSHKMDVEMESGVVNAFQTDPQMSRMDFLKEYPYEIEDMEIGSIIIRLRPLAEDAWKKFEEDCYSGTFKNFIANVYKSNTSCDKLKEGQYKIDVSIYTVAIPERSRSAATAPLKQAVIYLTNHKQADSEQGMCKPTNANDSFIARNFDMLCEEMEISSSLLTHLKANGILDNIMEKKIDQKQSRAEKVRCLLSYVSRQGIKGDEILKTYIIGHRYSTVLKETAKKTLYFSAIAVLNVTLVDATDQEGDLHSASNDWEILCSELVLATCHTLEKKIEADQDDTTTTLRLLQLKDSKGHPSMPVIASAINERFIVAAIDFGTTYSDYAYSFHHDFRDDPERITTNYWGNTPGGQPSMPAIASAIKERFIVAAIDFGTTYSGYAYSFHHDFRDDPLRIATNYWGNTSGSPGAAESWVAFGLAGIDVTSFSFPIGLESFFEVLAAAAGNID